MLKICPKCKESIHEMSITIRPKFFTTSTLQKLNSENKFLPLYTFHIQARCYCGAFIGNLPHTQEWIDALNNCIKEVNQCAFCAKWCCDMEYLGKEERPVCPKCNECREPS